MFAISKKKKNEKKPADRILNKIIPFKIPYSLKIPVPV